MRLVKSNQYKFHEICSGICCVIFFGQKCLICPPWSSLIYREVDSIKVLAWRNCCSNTNAAAEVAPNQSVGFSFIFSPTLKIRKLFLVKKFSCDKRKRSWNGKNHPKSLEIWKVLWYKLKIYLVLLHKLILTHGCLLCAKLSVSYHWWFRF